VPQGVRGEFYLSNVQISSDTGKKTLWEKGCRLVLHDKRQGDLKEGKGKKLLHRQRRGMR
jgi:hypothetical protein